MLFPQVDGQGCEGREWVDDLDLLEQIISAAATKVQVTASLHEARAVTEAEAGLCPNRCGRAVLPEEVGLVRRESRARARRARGHVTARELGDAMMRVCGVLPSDEVDAQ